MKSESAHLYYIMFLAQWLCVMAKEVQSAHSFDDMAEEHDSFDVELGESSHDDHNFDAELTETDQADPVAGNEDSAVDDPVWCYSVHAVSKLRTVTFVIDMIDLLIKMKRHII